MMLSDVCLSVAYIGPKSRTKRPRKTKICTEVTHVTRDSDTTFNLKRSNVKVTRPLYSPPCWRVRQLQRWAWERVGRETLLLRCRLLGRARRFGAHWGRRGAGAYRGGRPPTACLHYQAQCQCFSRRLIQAYMLTGRPATQHTSRCRPRPDLVVHVDRAYRQPTNMQPSVIAD